MKTIILLPCLLLACLAPSQTRVWENSKDQPTNSYGPAGTTTTFMGQPPATQWTRWPERGPAIDFGAPQILSEMSVYYLANTASSMTGNETVTVQIYANDGPAITGTRGSTLSEPGASPLFVSPAYRVYPGDQTLRVSLPSLLVPAKITWTLKFQGGLFDSGPFDPALNTNAAGGRFWCSVPSSQLQGNFGGVMFRRVFTSNGPSGWGAQDNPGIGAGFPGVFAFGGNFMTGNPSVVTAPYDNGTTVVGQAGILGLSGPVVEPTTNGSKAASLVTFSGPNRTVTRIDLGYLANTAASTGNPTFTVRLVEQDKTAPWFQTGSGGDPDLNQVLWSSGPQPVPLGLGGGGNAVLQNVTFNLPNVVVPDSFYWTFEVDGLSGRGDDVIGPRIQWSPKLGDSPNFVALFDNPNQVGAWQQFVFTPPNPPQTFIYTTVAQLGPIKFTTLAATSETLVPTSEQILLGTTNSGGDLASWAADDNNPRTVCKFFVPNVTSPYIRVNLNMATTKASATAIDFAVKVSGSTPGAKAITLNLVDKTTNTAVSTNVNLVNVLNGSVYTAAAPAPLARFIGGSGAMTGQIEIKQTGPSTQLLPCVSFEFANMIVTGS